MFGKTTLVALVGALSASANQVSNLMTRSEHAPFLARQITPAQIPQACQSQCTSALNIYQACTSGDTNTCLSVCQPSNYSNFVGCLQCVLSNTPGVSSSEVSSLNAVLGQLAGACSQAGQAVSSTALSAGSASRSASASGSSGVATASASATSRSASASSVSGSASGALASISSVINSASSSVAAVASSSRAAGQAVAALPQGLQSVVAGLVGIAAGVAYVL